MKKWLCIAGLLLLFIFVAIDPLSQAMASTNEIKVYINEQLVTFDVPPDLKEGTTMVPFRKVFEILGANVGWDEDNQIVTAFGKDGTIIILQIGKKSASVNNKNIELLRAPEKLKDRTMVPLRFISEALGAEVKWDEKKNEIRISLNSTGNANGGSGAKGDKLIYEPGQINFN